MPALQSVTLADRQAGSHAFTPRDRDNGVGVLASGSGVPLSEKRLTVSMKKLNSTLRGRLTLALPVVVNETINGVTVPRLARTAYANLEVTFDRESTESERDNAIGMIADALSTSKVLINDSFVKGESIW